MSVCTVQSLCGHRAIWRRKQREKISSNVSKSDLSLRTRKEGTRYQVQNVQRSGAWVVNDASIDLNSPAKRSGKQHTPRTMRHSSSPHPSLPAWHSYSKRSLPDDLELELSALISLSVNVDRAESDLSSSVIASTSQSSMSSATVVTSSASSSASSTAIISVSSVSASSSSSSSTIISSISTSTSTSTSNSSTPLSTTFSSSSSTPSPTSTPATSISSSSNTQSPTSTFTSSSTNSMRTTTSASPTTTTTSSMSPPMTVSTSPILTSSSAVGSSTISSSSTLSPSSASTTPVSSRSTALSITPTSSPLIPSSSLSIVFSSNTGSPITRSTSSYTLSLKHTSSLVTSSSTLPLNPSLAPSNANFPTNTGAIIGATIGGTVALVATAFALFLICGRVRRNRLGQPDTGKRGSRGGSRTVGTAAGANTEEMAEQDSAPLSATVKKLGILARGVSGSSSARPLNRTTSTISTPAWRSPLSDEDGDEEYPAPLPVSANITPGYGFGFGENSSSGHGHDHGSSSGHEHPSGSAESSGSTYNASSIQSSRSQGHNMPGFGQAAETMVGMGSSIPQPLSSHGHSTLFNQDRSHSSGTISSMKGNTHGTNSAGDGSGSSNSHSQSHSIKPSSLGGLSGTTSQTQGLSIQIPKVKINDQSVPSSPKRGFIERLRGGRSSTQGSSTTTTTHTPASSSYYPTYPAQSSLLNPPLPLPDAPLEPPVMPFLQPFLPLPSPALTDDSRMSYTDGLLNPVHSARAGETSINAPGNNSSVSLGDHVDYSRPFGGFVFNRMDSSTTFASADTRTTQPTIGTPVQQHPRDHHVDETMTADDGNQGSYFSAG
ncbi:hypothetical protein J3R30DRAFT_3752081 [Lentinula aciculospora]|uniref:Uncharacterized protein n=1 Tax=Lentinula aciculospora TaxID=153920 RepID=A0A9W9AUD0_9AGAR|nr:hypothetical protein J3R30DRAFT_3752081 [Lentinula aciculospora]